MLSSITYWPSFSKDASSAEKCVSKVAADVVPLTNTWAPPAGHLAAGGGSWRTQAKVSRAVPHRVLHVNSKCMTYFRAQFRQVGGVTQIGGQNRGGLDLSKYGRDGYQTNPYNETNAFVLH